MSLRTTEIELYDEAYFDELINDSTPPISIMGIAFTPSSVFKTDEPAYSEFCNNSQEYRTEYICPCCLETHDTEDDALECCLDEAVKSYLEAVIFTESGDDTGIYCLDDLTLSLEADVSAREDVKAFLLLTGHIISDLDISQVMHDFWLTRNRHGAGFWDGDYEEKLGAQLTKDAHSFGETSLYVGDDGLGYFA